MSHARERGLGPFEIQTMMSGEAAHEKRAKQARWLWRLVRRLGKTPRIPCGAASVREQSHDADSVLAAALASNRESTCGSSLQTLRRWTCASSRCRRFASRTATFFLCFRMLARARKLALYNHLHLYRTLKLTHALSALGLATGSVICPSSLALLERKIYIRDRFAVLHVRSRQSS